MAASWKGRSSSGTRKESRGGRVSSRGAGGRGAALPAPPEASRGAQEERDATLPRRRAAVGEVRDAGRRRARRRRYGRPLFSLFAGNAPDRARAGGSGGQSVRFERCGGGAVFSGPQ